MRTLTPITYADYSNYAPARLAFNYQGSPITFARGPQYLPISVQCIQPEEQTASNHPIVYDPVIIQEPFTAAFSMVTDAELAALRTFIGSTVPCGDTFTFIEVVAGRSFPVQFSSRRLKIKQIRIDHNEVSLAMVRV